LWWNIGQEKSITMQTDYQEYLGILDHVDARHRMILIFHVDLAKSVIGILNEWVQVVK
jgi:hypothetical protein